jgi:hypothetical protein
MKANQCPLSQPASGISQPSHHGDGRPSRFRHKLIIGDGRQGSLRSKTISAVQVATMVPQPEYRTWRQALSTLPCRPSPIMSLWRKRDGRPLPSQSIQTSLVRSHVLEASTRSVYPCKPLVPPDTPFPYPSPLRCPNSSRAHSTTPTTRKTVSPKCLSAAHDRTSGPTRTVRSTFVDRHYPALRLR